MGLDPRPQTSFHIENRDQHGAREWESFVFHRRVWRQNVRVVCWHLIAVAMRLVVCFTGLLGGLILADSADFHLNSQQRDSCPYLDDAPDFGLSDACPRISETLQGGRLSLQMANALVHRARCMEAYLEDQTRANTKTLRMLAAAAARAGLFATVAESLQRAELLAGECLAANRHFELAERHQASFNLELSLEGFQGGLAIQPSNTTAWDSLGVALYQLGQRGAALRSFQTCTRLNPSHRSCLYHLVELLRSLHMFEEAVSAAEQGFRMLPNEDALLSRLVVAQSHICGFALAGYDARVDRMLGRCLRADSPCITPYEALWLPCSPNQALKAAQYYAATSTFPTVSHSLGARMGGAVRVLEVGYVGACLKDDKLGHYLWSALALHQAHRIRAACFATGVSVSSADRLWKERILEACAAGADVSALSDIEAVAAINARGLHILVDLDGWNHGGRPALLAARPAPITVHLIQFPGTTGMPYVDYFVSDHITAPPELATRSHFSESLALLPPSYQLLSHRWLADASVRHSRRHGRDSEHANTLAPYATLVPTQARNGTIRTALRQHASLPGEGVFLYASFNQLYKLDRQTFTAWAGIVARRPDAALWIILFASAAEASLRQLASQLGLPAHQLVFTPPLPAQHHLAVKAAADVFLDARPFNAHSTLGDALHAGLPALTLPGEKVAARVASGILMGASLSFMVARTWTDYVEMGVRVGRDGKRWEWRERVSSQAARKVFDVARWIERWEKMLFEMWDVEAIGGFESKGADSTAETQRAHLLVASWDGCDGLEGQKQ